MTEEDKKILSDELRVGQITSDGHQSANVVNDSESKLELFEAALINKSHPALLTSESDSDSKKDGSSEDEDALLKLNVQLFKAVTAGNLENVVQFIENGADINYVDKFGRTCLRHAIHHGYYDIVAEFLKRGLDVNAMDPIFNMTPIMNAAKKGRHRIVQLLQQHGARLDLQSATTGWTVLMFAAESGHMQTVTELLLLGADMHLADSRGNTAVQKAQVRGHVDTVKIFESWQEPKIGNKNMMDAAKAGKDSLIKCLIRLGADMRHRDSQNNVALHLAARHGHVGVIRVLLELGLDVNIRGRSQRTALMEAAGSDHLGAVCELLEWGADTELQNRPGFTAQQFADRKRSGTIGLLLKKGDIEPNDALGGEALLAVTENGNKNTICDLLQRGVNMDLHQNKNGETALQVAARIERDDIVKMLLTNKISKYSETSIEKRVANIIKYAESVNFNSTVFEDKEVQKFYMVKDDEGVSMLEAIVDLKLLKEQEQLLDILTQIDRINFQSKKEMEEFRITEQIKVALQSSEGLKEIIDSLQNRYPWTSGKKWFMILLSFLSLLMAWFFFGFDLYTDMRFSLDMKDNYIRVFRKKLKVTYTRCQENFNQTFANASNICNANWTSLNCTRALLQSANFHDDECSLKGNRFEDCPYEWQLAATISAVHCVLPFVVSITTWIIIAWKNWKKTSIFQLPIIFFTETYHFYCKWNLYNILARQDRDDNDETRKQFEQDHEHWQRKIVRHDYILNLSKLIEAAVESGFQESHHISVCLEGNNFKVLSNI